MTDSKARHVTWLGHKWETHDKSDLTVWEKEVSLQDIRSGFEFVPGLFGIVLRGGYVYGAWPRTVLILLEFKSIVQESWQLVMFCTWRILPEGLRFVENFPLRWNVRDVTWLIHVSHVQSYVTYMRNDTRGIRNS